jgi:hypothetical protein
MAHSVAVPTVLTDPGMLWIAPIGTTDPFAASTAVGGIFTDDPPVAWIPLGATTEGSTFSYSTNVEAVKVAEFFDPIKYPTTDRSGHIAFNLASFTLSNYQRALQQRHRRTDRDQRHAATSLFKLEPSTRATRCGR